MIKKIIIFTGLLTLFLTFSVGFSAFGAQGVNIDSRNGPPVTLENPLGPNTDLRVLIGKILKLVAELGAIVCIFFIIYAGFLFIKAQGNETELTKAKSVLLWSVVGTAVLLGASVIADLIIGTVESVTGQRIR